MLRKLLKYDLRASFVPVGLLFAGAVLLFALATIFKALAISQMVVSFTIFLVLAGIAMLVMAAVVLVMRFYKGVFGAEGYLTQTLPVSKGSILVSKFITAALLLIAAFIGCFLAIAGAFYLTDVPWIQQIKALIGVKGWQYPFIFVAVAGLVQIGAAISQVYAAITLSNTRMFLKNNILFAVIFYFASTMIVSILEMLGMLLIPLGLQFTGNGVSFVFSSSLQSFIDGTMTNNSSNFVMGVGSVFIDIAVGVGLFVATRWMLIHKASVK